MLIEVQAEANGFCSAVISFGLNVNMVSDNKNVDQNWTSIRRITNKYNDRNILCSKLISNLLTYIKNFEQYGLQYFMNEWKSKDSLMNKPINVMQGNDKYTGKAIGINTQGHLMIELNNGAIKSFSSGDTTVLKSQL